MTGRLASPWASQLNKAAVPCWVLLWVAENKTNKEIGEGLFISHRTVETHRSNICQKLQLQGAHKLLQFAIEHRSEI